MLNDIYQRLFSAFGSQGWWPAETAFEVMIGAILTQNTNWKNVETAIGRLRNAKMLDPDTLFNCPQHKLAGLIKSAGYFNVKAQRIKNYLEWYCTRGGYDSLNDISTSQLRSELLCVKGIGPETADDILLYAFNRPVFVVDAYLRRILTRVGLLSGNAEYEQVRRYMESHVEPDVEVYQEYHALIVKLAKRNCLKTALCDACCLLDVCVLGRGC